VDFCKFKGTVCEENNVECVITNRMYENKNDKLNKGKAINEGIKKLKQKDWLLITDADIAFPINTRDIIERDAIEKKQNVLCSKKVMPKL